MNKEEQMIITKYDLLYEQRMTRVESAIENMSKTMDSMDRHMRDGFKEMKTDFRWLVLIMLSGFGVSFGAMAALYALMAHGFKWF